MTAYLLLAAVAWSVAARGGTSLRDMIVALALVSAGAVAGRARLRVDPRMALAVVALVTWMIVDGPVRAGWGLESVRLPLLVLIVGVAAAAAVTMDRGQRETWLAGLIAVGCIEACVAVGQAAARWVSDAGSVPRADALLGAANGLGMMLVATSLVTARMRVRGRPRRPGRVGLAAALTLQACGVLATGSRAAILVGAAVLLGSAVARREWRLTVLAAVPAGIGAAVVVVRTAREGLGERAHLWGEAWRRVVENPLVGEGPAGAPYSTSAPGAPVTTHAHSELLQWTVEYGVIGIALLVLVVALVWRRRDHGAARGDPWLRGAAAVAVLAGATDFALRITAVALVASILAAMALSRVQRTHVPGGPVDVEATRA